MTFERLDVVVVPFPFTDKLATKRRPAVVISTPGSLASGRAVLAMVTSSTRETWPSDAHVQDLADAGLTVPSLVRMKVFTLDESQILRRLGRLSERDGMQMENALCGVFGLRSNREEEKG